MYALASLRGTGSRLLSEACLDAVSRNASKIESAKDYPTLRAAGIAQLPSRMVGSLSSGQ